MKRRETEPRDFLGRCIIILIYFLFDRSGNRIEHVVACLLGGFKKLEIFGI